MRIYQAMEIDGRHLGFFASYREAKQVADRDGYVETCEYPCTKDGLLAAMNYAQGIE